MPLDTSFGLALVPMGDADGDETRLPAGYEAWELSGDTVRPIDILDEALVMALPMAPKHSARDECVAFATGPAETDAVTPFATLRARMAEKKQD